MERGLCQAMRVIGSLCFGILLANPKGGLTPALSTQWRGSRRREVASSIL